MTNLEPFEVFESLIEREAAEARKKRASLHVVAFRVKNFKAIIKEKGFNRYRGLLDRFAAQIRREIGDSGVVHILTLNKVVLLLIKKDAEDANRLINDVKRSVSELLKKEKEKLPLSISPFRTSYPNESRSVSEIIQLIE
jgi:GGDEF domain-containing protein